MNLRVSQQSGFITASEGDWSLPRYPPDCLILLFRVLGPLVGGKRVRSGGGAKECRFYGWDRITVARDFLRISRCRPGG